MMPTTEHGLELQFATIAAYSGRGQVAMDYYARLGLSTMDAYLVLLERLSQEIDRTDWTDEQREEIHEHTRQVEWFFRSYIEHMWRDHAAPTQEMRRAVERDLPGRQFYDADPPSESSKFWDGVNRALGHLDSLITSVFNIK